MLKSISIIIIALSVSTLFAQSDSQVDPFETEEERSYRYDNPDLSKLDSNYVEYWCSIDILKKTNENYENLNLFAVGDFLATFHPSCKTNVEYSEWSNELLFKVLMGYPNETLAILTKNNSLYRSHILSELSNPISDKIEIQSVIETLNKIDDDYTPKTRMRIIKELKQIE